MSKTTTSNNFEVVVFTFFGYFTYFVNLDINFII